MTGRYWVYGIKLMVVALLLLPLTAYAQLKTNVTHYSTKDGLSHDGVLCITRDRDGFMWFGTFDGIDRFDGHSFVVYKSRPGDRSNLKSNKVRNIVEDNAGYLWIQTFDYKVYRFDKRTEQFLAISDGVYKALFKDQVVVDQIIPDRVRGVWLLTKNQGMYYACCEASGQAKVTRYMPGQNSAYSVSGLKVKFHYTDVKGRVWVGTERGLNCLQRDHNNGYSVVKFNAVTERELSGRSFTCEASDLSNLYFGTDDGKLLVYDLKSQTFVTRQVTEGIRLNSICIAKTKAMYISTSGKGLLQFDPISGKSVQLSLKGDATYLSLYEAGNGAIWIEPDADGVIKYNPDNGSFKHFIQKKDFTSASRSYRILTDANGVLWVSMRGGGFGYYDAATDDLKYFFNEPGSVDQKFSNVVTSLYVDPTGVLWISAKDGGINKVVLLTDQFNYHRVVSKPQNRSENDVRAMMKDARGRLWVCTKDGLVHVYENGKDVKVFKASNNRIGFVYSIIEDSKGNVWLGTKGNGVYKATPAGADKQLYTLQNFRHKDDDNNSLSYNMVYSIIEDRKGRIWVGTLGGGLNLFSETNGTPSFKNCFNSFKSYPFPWAKGIRHLCEDDKGRIWIATSYGLLVFDPDKPVGNDYQFYNYQKIPGNPNSLGSNSVQYVCKDRIGKIWVGTFGGGLNQVILDNNDISHARFKAFTMANGLPNDVVLGITADRQNNLWIATAGGLSKFDPRKQVFKNYDPFNGLSNANFSEASGMVAQNGELYFACVDGYLSFNPQAIVHKKVSAKLALTNMQLYYKNILPGNNSPLKYAINETRSLTLGHDQNVISIDYALLDYGAESKVSYAYKLEGFDKTWHFVNDLRKATYTNISPGTYTFQVKAIGEDLFDVIPQKTLEIVIKSPFYLTFWAYFIYFILAVIAIVIARNIIATMIRLRNKVIIEQKLTEVKLSFFTNISHELRTPLTLIASPLEELAVTEKLSLKGQEYFKIVNRNVNRMIRFTNQLLDFRKIQSGKMQINVAETDLVTLAKEVGACFTTLAAEKNISFKVVTDREVVPAWIDEEKIEIVLYNLLSNAFKFSPSGKQVVLEIINLTDAIEVKIIDQGKGVAEENLEEIFEIYHEENPLKENHLKGTGIGLALARGLTVSHKGKLWAQLNPTGGMTFILRLQTGHQHFTADELSDAGSSHVLKHLETQEKVIILPLQLKDSLDTTVPQILIVEDNPDLRSFLELTLNSFYRVLKAADGAEGLKLAQSASPDLIISDVVMPNMDGIQMLDKLRHDAETSHIPVILLTAKTSVDSRLKGLQYGADIYLTKPFHNEILLASIQNLLTSRKRLFEQFAGLKKENVFSFEMEAPITTSKDEEFLKDVIKIVEERINDANFNIDEVATGISMGRSTFYKKLKNLSGLSPVEFVRELRLKRSKVLLDTGSYTVSEVGYMAGFNSLAYFSTCFKEKYQTSPSAYLKTVKAESKHHSI